VALSGGSDAWRRAGRQGDTRYEKAPVQLLPEAQPWQSTPENTANVAPGMIPAWKIHPPRPDVLTPPAPPPQEPPTNVARFALESPAGVDPRPLPGAPPPAAPRGGRR
jgi:hypothetical protein